MIELITNISNFFSHIWDWITNIFDYIGYVSSTLTGCFSWLGSMGLPASFIALLGILLPVLLALKMARR